MCHIIHKLDICVLGRGVSVNELTPEVKGQALFQLSCQRSRAFVFRKAVGGRAQCVCSCVCL